MALFPKLYSLTPPKWAFSSSLLGNSIYLEEKCSFCDISGGSRFLRIGVMPFFVKEVSNVGLVENVRRDGCHSFSEFDHPPRHPWFVWEVGWSATPGLIGWCLSSSMPTRQMKTTRTRPTEEPSLFLKNLKKSPSSISLQNHAGAGS